MVFVTIYFLIGLVSVWIAYKLWKKDCGDEFTLFMLALALGMFFLWPLVLLIVAKETDWDDVKLWTKKDGWFWNRLRVKR